METKRRQLEQNSEMLKHSRIIVYTQTRRGKEGLGEAAVSGDVSDLWGDINKSTDHRGNPVEAQNSEKDKVTPPFLASLLRDSLYSVFVPVKMEGGDLCVVPFKVREVEEVCVCFGLSGLPERTQTHMVLWQAFSSDGSGWRGLYLMGLSRACP